MSIKELKSEVTAIKNKLIALTLDKTEPPKPPIT